MLLSLYSMCDPREIFKNNNKNYSFPLRLKKKEKPGHLFVKYERTAKPR